MNHGPIHTFLSRCLLLLCGLAGVHSALAKDIYYIVSNSGNNTVTCQAFTATGSGSAQWRKTFGVGPGQSRVFVTTLTDQAITFTLKYGGAGTDFTSPDSYTQSAAGSGDLDVGPFRVSSSGEVVHNKYLKVAHCNVTAVNQSYTVVDAGTGLVLQNFSLKPTECYESVVGPYPSDNLPNIQVQGVSPNPDGTVNVLVFSSSHANDWGTNPNGSNSAGIAGNQSGAGVSGYGSSDAPGYVSPVDFGGSETGTDLAKEKTLQHVGASLYTALGQGFYATVESVNNANVSVKQTHGRLDTANNSLGLIYSRLWDVQSGVSSVGTKVDTVGGHVAAGNTKLDGIKSSTDANGVKLNSMDISLADIRANTVTANSHLSAVKDNTLGTKDAVNSSTNVMGAVKVSVDSATNVLGGLLLAIKNKLFSPPAVGTHDAAADYAAGETAATAKKNDLATLATASGNALNNVKATTFSPIVAWNVSLGGTTVDLNPMARPEIAGIAPWIRNFIHWSLCFGIVGSVWHIAATIMMRSGAWNQGKAIVQGTAEGVASILPYGSAMKAVWWAAAAVLPATFIGWSQTNQYLFDVINFNPLSNSNPAIANGLWLLDQFFPVVTAVSGPLITFAFYLTMVGVGWLKQHGLFGLSTQ